MVAREKTEVIYDTSQAIVELQKLDKQVVRSAAATEKAFGEQASSGLEKFGTATDESTGRTRELSGELVTLASNSARIVGDISEATEQTRKFGQSAAVTASRIALIGRAAQSIGAAAVFAGAATAVAAFGAVILRTVGSVIDLAGQLRDVNAGLETINETAERTLRFRQLAGAFGDAEENRRLELSRRNLTLQSAQLQLRQNELQAAQDLSAELIRTRTAEFNEIDAAFQRSLNNRLSAEQRLESKRRELAVGQVVAGGRTTGGAIADLAERATKEAQEGNVDLAEQLIGKAQELSNELGNHVFFANQIEDANKAVVKALEDEVKEAKSQEDNLAAQRIELQGRVDDAKEFESALARELEIMGRQRNALRGNRRIIQDSAQALRDLQQQEGGQELFETGITQVRRVTESVGGEPGLAQFRDTIQRAFGLAGGQAGTTLPSGLRDIDAIASAVGDSLEAALEDKVITPREAEGIAQQLTGVSDALGLVEQGIAEGALSPQLERGVERVTALFQGLENAIQGAIQFQEGGGGRDVGVTPGAVAEQRARVERIVEQRNVQQEVTLNVNGAVIDENTLKQLTERIRRELRKETIRN